MRVTVERKVVRVNGVLCRLCAVDLEDLSAVGSSGSEAWPPIERNIIIPLQWCLLFVYVLTL